jgi:adenosylmethionine-8-amino-7-oxononanoate aminotransferase
MLATAVGKLPSGEPVDRPDLQGTRLRPDILAMSPALIVEKTQIDALVEKLADSIRQAS